MSGLIRTILCLLLAFCLTAGAADGDRVLKDIKSRYAGSEAWRIAFEHECLWKDEGVSTSDSGRLLLQQKAFRVDLAGQHLLSDGKTLWRWHDEGGQVLVETLGQTEDVILPQQLLVELDQRFKAGTAQAPEQNRRIVPLTPRGDSQFMQDVTLEASRTQGAWQLEVLSYEDIQGNRHSYRLQDRQGWSRASLPDSLGAAFRFELPVGFELIDLR
ncbi:MAG: outer-membrane lipoprotein carrier protein LolA [Candidatus Cloacimonetes bacterium]|nr:outer-membrane lipoprotein carrier protein LolA [Candidatus Cloacimonadota bacterium]